MEYTQEQVEKIEQRHESDAAFLQQRLDRKKVDIDAMSDEERVNCCQNWQNNERYWRERGMSTDADYAQAIVSYIVSLAAN